MPKTMDDGSVKSKWGRLAACRPIGNRPPWDDANAARGRLTIGRRLPACPTWAQPGYAWAIRALVLWSLFSTAMLLAQSVPQRTWDARALSDWATPLASIDIRPGHFSGGEYYRAPLDNYRTYPVYHPDREATGYWDTQEGLIDRGKGGPTCSELSVRLRGRFAGSAPSEPSACGRFAVGRNIRPDAD